MGKNKRPRDEVTTESIRSGHSEVPPKRRKHTTDDAELANIYNDLADEVQTVRVKAAGDLLRIVTSDAESRDERVAAAQRRLIRGLCSGRKAARLGFSIALAEVFRLKYGPIKEKGGGRLDLKPSIDEITTYTEPDRNVGGQERRDHLLGRRFAYQALLQSDVGLRKSNQQQWKMLMRHIFQLARQKQWLRREVGGMLYDYLTSPSGAQIRSDLLEDAEGVGLWLTMQENFPSVALPDNVWKGKNPLSKSEISKLAGLLLESGDDDQAPVNRSGGRQALPSFVWTLILFRLSSTDDEREFSHFWTNCVSAMFSEKSSPERKALGLQIFAIAISTLPAWLFPHMVTERIFRCILDQRTKADNNLFEAAKVPLNTMVSRAKQNPDAASVLVDCILGTGTATFDQQTKTKTLESIVSYANSQSLLGIAIKVRSVIHGSKLGDNTPLLDAHGRGLSDILLTMVRTHKEDAASLSIGTSTKSTLNDSWLVQILKDLSQWAYSEDQLAPIFRPKLMSILNILMTGPLRQAPIFVARSARETSTRMEQMSGRSRESLENAYKCMDEMYATEKGNDELIAGNEAFALLFALSILQVLAGEPDAVAALEDLITCWESRGSNNDDSTTMVIEILLSFVSKPSALFRKLAEQVFAAFASELTSDSLQSLVDILGQKETLTGQQELFDAHDEGEHGGEAEEDEEDDDVEEIDVEDASDVELVNGEVILGKGDVSDGSDEDTSDAEGGAANGQDDEEAAFDKKLAEALGTGRLDEEDSEDDGSDMDDDQMMALEPHLTSIFKERQKTSSKKQEKKDAKENIVNFKNRVLDLLAIFVKGQYDSLLALNLIMPLLELVRVTTNKQTGEKAFAVLKQYFDACNKHKQLPQPADVDVLFGLLTDVQADMRLGGSKLFANACSRSSLFLAKAIVGIDKQYYERIASMYNELMTEWWTDSKSNLQPTIFTEWTSWSIATRKITS